MLGAINRSVKPNGKKTASILMLMCCHSQSKDDDDDDDDDDDEEEEERSRKRKRTEKFPTQQKVFDCVKLGHLFAFIYAGGNSSEINQILEEDSYSFIQKYRLNENSVKC